MTDQKVVILTGSPADEAHAKKIGASVEEFGVKCVYRVSSAHKTPAALLEILKELEKEADKGEKIVLVAAVGLSNALSGVLAAQSIFPVITCPVFAPEDLMSSLRMPSGVPHSVVLDPKNAGLEAIRILALSDKALAKKLKAHRDKAMQRVMDADKALNK